MAQALCENDHPLVTGESRCTLCGERIKMQWMRYGSSPRRAPARDLYSPSRLAVALTLHVLWGALFVWGQWDNGLELWQWLIVAGWFVIFIPWFIWDWRRHVRKAQTAEPTA